MAKTATNNISTDEPTTQPLPSSPTHRSDIHNYDSDAHSSCSSSQEGGIVLQGRAQQNAQAAAAAAAKSQRQSGTNMKDVDVEVNAFASIQEFFNDLDKDGGDEYDDHGDDDPQKNGIVRPSTVETTIPIPTRREHRENRDFHITPIRKKQSLSLHSHTTVSDRMKKSKSRMKQLSEATKTPTSVLRHRKQRGKTVLPTPDIGAIHGISSSIGRASSGSVKKNSRQFNRFDSSMSVSFHGKLMTSTVNSANAKPSSIPSQGVASSRQKSSSRSTFTSTSPRKKRKLGLDGPFMKMLKTIRGSTEADRVRLQCGSLLEEHYQKKRPSKRRLMDVNDPRYHAKTVMDVTIIKNRKGLGQQPMHLLSPYLKTYLGCIHSFTAGTITNTTKDESKQGQPTTQASAHPTPSNTISYGWICFCEDTIREIGITHQSRLRLYNAQLLYTPYTAESIPLVICTRLCEKSLS